MPELPGEKHTGGKRCLSATADIGFDDVDAEEYDGLIIPGGWAPDKIRRYDSVKRFVADFYHQGKVIGMICHAGLVGISAGIVSGLEATGSEGIMDDLINAGATWKNLPALRSRNVVWGRVVADIPDFCRELVKAFIEQKQAEQIPVKSKKLLIKAKDFSNLDRFPRGNR